MKHRLFNLFVMFGLLASLAGAGSARAQTPEPPWPDDPDLHPVRPPRAEAAADEAGAQHLTLGEPGLSFRYASTFGTTGQAYFDLGAYLNYPIGLGVEGTDVWIAEVWGNRAVKYDNAGNYLDQIGTAGESDPESLDTVLSEVVDVGVSDGKVWLVDEDASHIAYFDATTLEYLDELGVPWEAGTSNDRFDAPAGIAFDAAGNIYVSDGAPWWGSGVDYGNHRVQIFDSSGNWIGRIGATGIAGTANNRLHGPRHLALDASAQLLYIADSGNHRIQVFSIATPAAPSYIATLGVSGEYGDDNGHFRRPSGVAVDANYIYVADTFNARVQVFSKSTRAYVTTIGEAGVPGDDSGQLEWPFDVAVGSDGKLYVADFANTRVQQFTVGGTLEAPTFAIADTYGETKTPYSTNGYHFNGPRGITLAPDGSMYIVEYEGHRLVKLNAAGVYQWQAGTAGIKGDWDNSNEVLDNPSDAAVDALGMVYVADKYEGRVQIFTSAGAYYDTLWGFDCPSGLHIAPNGYLYVADPCTYTVEIFDGGLSWIGRIGTQYVSGSDNAHFGTVEDVAVDGLGTIYVSDQGNRRVQVFNSSRAYVHTIGVTGEGGSDFGHFSGPDGLFVDAANRLYVADRGNNRVQVFDANHAYLTTIGGGWGRNNGQLRGPGGVAVDNEGNVFVADQNNHRIQKFARRVPGWEQMNVNGFGDRRNTMLSAVESFGGKLYAGAGNVDGVEIWRSADGKTWSAAMTGGYGDPLNNGFDVLFAFNGYLYSGGWRCSDADCTAGAGEAWRSPNGTTWSRVVQGGFGNPNNGEVYNFVEFNGKLYASTWTLTSAQGTEIYRSATGASDTWTRVVANGFGDPNNMVAAALISRGGYLYAGTYNHISGAEIWRSATGNEGDWAQVNTDGFGSAIMFGVPDLAEFGSHLYASTRRIAGGGAEVWRCEVCDGTDWESVASNGLGDPETRSDNGLEVFGGQLYFAALNPTVGTVVWRCETCDGTDWEQIGFGGFGDPNTYLYADKTAVFNGRLYIAAYNNGNAGKLWSPSALDYPAVMDITRVNTSPTARLNIEFLVTFTENVTGVDKYDFNVATTGVSGTSIIGVSGGGDTYTVTVDTGTGNGTIEVEVSDDNSIVDAATGTKYLGGPSVGDGDFSAGQIYTIQKVVTFKSSGSQDGWILESGENSSKGGSLNAGGTALFLGDDATDKQYRAVLSFNTASIPEDAVIEDVTLSFKRTGLVGANPFSKLGNIWAAFKTGAFGTKSTLQIGDFQAAPTQSDVLEFFNAPVNNWYSTSLGSGDFGLINLGGVTQIRLAFLKGDNDNHVADYLKIASGNAGSSSRPKLIITYYVP